MENPFMILVSVGCLISSRMSSVGRHSSEHGNLNCLVGDATADDPTWLRKPGEGLGEAHLITHNGSINVNCQVNYAKFQERNLKLTIIS